MLVVVCPSLSSSSVLKGLFGLLSCPFDDLSPCRSAGAATGWEILASSHECHSQIAVSLPPYSHGRFRGAGGALLAELINELLVRFFELTRLQSTELSGSVRERGVDNNQYNKNRFVDALRARLREVAPEIRKQWNSDDLEKWWHLVRSEPALSWDDTPDVSRYVRGMCSDLFGPHLAE